MRLNVLLFGLYHMLWLASKTNKKFKNFIRKAKVRLMIRTEDGRYARLFVFDWGKLSTANGPDHPCDAALIWKDPSTAFSVLLKKDHKAVFQAAAEGKLKVEGMGVYALWFDSATKLVL